MTKEEFKKIMTECVPIAWEGDSALKGLNIIHKYLPDKTILVAAEHDIIYSVDVDELIDAGLTDEDANELRALNWGISEFDSLCCFV